ncbi:sulfatase-like hydrolase/transferase [Lewinella sp. W8]|uniref:sulfatase-like hydrolase/transferase n=1 Tax=Lewinella sp. W8 TaxID=2528208 RepID=UPI001563FEF7|nr:sulfatase-like hydrolase/transferase [Lewinella sp. W8]
MKKSADLVRVNSLNRIPKMSTYRFLVLALFLATLACTTESTPPGTTAATTTTPPNILFVLTDDQGYGDLSLHGNDSLDTPNMDAFLRSAARFDRFYVSPVCAPTRASFLSGQYAPRTGAIFVTRRRETMSDSIQTVAELLRDAGYRTGLFGKWHNGATFPYHPTGQGFSDFLGFTLGHFNDYYRGELQNEWDQLVPFSGDLTKILTDTAAHFMLRETEQPFFCMLTYQAPHTPVQAPDSLWRKYQQRGLSDYNAGIYAMIENVDAQFGRLLDSLEAAGVLDNTVVVFSTDNGPNGDRYNRNLRGRKGQIDEGGVRVPFGIRLPGDHPANGKLLETPAAHIDLLPTLLDLAGQGARTPKNLDGKSLVPLLEGDPSGFDDRYIYTFLQGYNFSPYPGSMRNQEYLYVRRGADEHELYDLHEDEGQQKNLFGQRDGLGREMADRYAAFAATVARPDLVAPPIDLGAAPGPIRLLAHEGEPRGKTRFRETNGWANDFFVDLGQDGALWPIRNPRDVLFDVQIAYHLAGDEARTVVLSDASGNARTLRLQPAVTEELPVADRVPRKEVYPRSWATATLKDLRIKAGATALTISGPDQPGLWIKELTLMR